MQGGIDLGPIADRIQLLTPLLRETLAAAAHGLDKHAAAAKLGCRVDAYDQRFNLLYKKIGIEHLGRGEKRRVALDAYRLYERGAVAQIQDGNGASAPREAMLPDVPRGISGGYGVASVVSLGKCESILDVRTLVLGPAFAAELARARREGYELHGSFVHYQSLSDTTVSLTQMFLVRRQL
ncbi:MAG: hypothetical protein Q8P36_01000 [bacterium]|nr:hypothetical protein [bacterium]